MIITFKVQLGLDLITIDQSKNNQHPATDSVVSTAGWYKLLDLLYNIKTANSV